MKWTPCTAKDRLGSCGSRIRLSARVTKRGYADMTLYTAESGAIVFATGSMQWNWGLDGYNAPQWHSLRTTGAAQQVTRNILDRMLQGRGQPRGRRSTVRILLC
jgi:hypothetical protein